MIKDILKYLPILTICGGMAFIYFHGYYQYLSLDYLRMYHNTLKMFVGMYPIGFPVLFCFVYVVSTTLSIPGAIFLTIAGGYLFPQPLSTILVVLSATCGAILIFVAARTALKDALRARAGPFLQKMEHGFQEHSVSYLLFLRLVPLFPFWLVNIAPAFFNVSLYTFAWTTLVGIFPGTLVFTLAGGGLETILGNNEPLWINTIFNAQIKLALGLLGLISLLPIALKR